MNMNNYMINVELTRGEVESIIALIKGSKPGRHSMMRLHLQRRFENVLNLIDDRGAAVDL